MERTILVISSSRDEPYSVEISSPAENGLTIICDCPAGEWGKHCKHKMDVALGDAKILYDYEQIDGFNEVSNLIDASNYPKRFSEIRVAEQQLEEAKKNVKNMKGKIFRFMKDGLK